ncbi:hypothetical protein [Dictyobacter kobayashii]|uniref:Uncharacterized protein n=1 Tax=Dictyobacter kobayashii TaxID=2014872 RepID=A0A402AI45_9CHLR|nr:hypothetical protein [Dictyobacter kobayashii]GCE18790.1 hypothetical protein KDK_25900 [Dictyobacter kobayashii]
MLSTMKMFLAVVPVIMATIVFCSLLPALTLLEIFLVSIGMLILLTLHIWVVREIIKLIDFRHRLKLQQELREIDFERAKQQRQISDIRSQRANRGRNHFR